MRLFRNYVYYHFIFPEINKRRLEKERRGLEYFSKINKRGRDDYSVLESTTLCPVSFKLREKRVSFFILNLKICHKDELPETLLTIHLTTLHNILTTPTPFHKKHRTKLKLNRRLQKATYSNLSITTETCFAVDVDLINSKI